MNVWQARFHFLSLVKARAGAEWGVIADGVAGRPKASVTAPNSQSTKVVHGKYDRVVNSTFGPRVCLDLRSVDNYAREGLLSHLKPISALVSIAISKHFRDNSKHMSFY